MTHTQRNDTFSLRILFATIAILILSSCTHESAYKGLQEREKQECMRRFDIEYEECIKQFDKSYEDYERERQELLKDKSENAEE
ncbi:hypothetical protein [Teredinibacter sp. KSP-S5-2]|uniref:hypothetical protein n=1 Tax=Teredinibacter sp. KSP-S5-2 TaxID=3034506 RepID=UPI002934AA39|nr:hypothetical protein [Teredinibacter sp. KSP-S5-2]WNO10277.1 hypothetical protein P5V12_03730 [Teredinibacter sp. KSP-S5-2]